MSSVGVSPAGHPHSAVATAPHGTLVPATLRDRGRCLSVGKGAESQGGDHSEQKG